MPCGHKDCFRWPSVASPASCASRVLVFRTVLTRSLSRPAQGRVSFHYSRTFPTRCDSGRTAADGYRQFPTIGRTGPFRGAAGPVLAVRENRQEAAGNKTARQPVSSTGNGRILQKIPQQQSCGFNRRAGSGPSAGPGSVPAQVSRSRCLAKCRPSVSRSISSCVL